MTVRVATGVLALVCLVTTALFVRGVLPMWSAQLRACVLVSALLTFVGFVHTSRPIYSRWLRVAEALHLVVISVLFGSLYLIVVPVFALIIWPFDVLRARKSQSLRDSFWIAKPPAAVDKESLQRMG